MEYTGLGNWVTLSTTLVNRVYKIKYTNKHETQTETSKYYDCGNSYDFSQW